MNLSNLFLSTACDNPGCAYCSNKGEFNTDNHTPVVDGVMMSKARV